MYNYLHLKMTFIILLFDTIQLHLRSHTWHIIN